jgi:hypothetical protein
VDQVRVRVMIAVMSVFAVGTGCTFSWQSPRPGGVSSPVETSLPSPSPSVRAASRSPQATSATPPDVEGSLRLIEDQVSLLRGLAPSAEIPLRLLSPADLGAEALEDCARQRAPDALGPEASAMLGLPGAEFNLDSTYTSLATDWATSLTSLYDEASQTITLREPPGFDPTSRLDYITSYLSALRMEVLHTDLAMPCCPIGCASADDADLAVAALVLGDTRLAQEQWVRIYGDREDADQFGNMLDPAGEASLVPAPQYLEDTYGFALSGGRAFVQDLYLSGGWPAVDAAYADPPTSSEQILHPERYPMDGPLPVQAPELGEALGPDWELRQTTGLGEWRTRQMLQVYLSPDEAAEAAGNWGGDVLMTYYNPALDQDILILITRWDNLRQAQDFALAFRKYGEARFGERRPTTQADTWTWVGGYTLLERISDQTLWILAPDKETAESARAGMTFPVPVR